MNTIGKVCLALAIPVLTTGSICGVYYGIKYNNVDRQTVEDDSGMLNVVKELQESVAKLKEEKKTLTSRYATLEANYEALVEKRDALLAQNEGLTEENTELSAQIESLNTEIAQLETERTSLLAQIDSLNASIEEKDALIHSYEIEIKRLEDLLADYEYLKDQENLCEVTFYVGENAVKTSAINKGTTVTSLPPSTNEYRIDGWVDSEGNAVDPANITITENTSFYANITDKYPVTYFVNGQVYSTQYVCEGEYPTAVADPNNAGYIFEYWAMTESGTGKVDPTTVVIENNTYFYAKGLVSFEITEEDISLYSNLLVIAGENLNEILVFTYDKTTGKTDIVISYLDGRDNECIKHISFIALANTNYTTSGIMEAYQNAGTDVTVEYFTETQEYENKTAYYRTDAKENVKLEQYEIECGVIIIERGMIVAEKTESATYSMTFDLEECKSEMRAKIDAYVEEYLALA